MEKEEKKESVLFYTDWAGPLRMLPLEEVGELFLGILSYTASGEEPRFESPAAAMAWEFLRLRLDANLHKWDATRQKRREAGSRGGKLSQAVQASARRASAESPVLKQNQANQANASPVKQTQANQAVPVPEPVPVPVPEPVPVTVPVPEPVPGKTSSSSSDQTDRTTTTISPELVWKECGYDGMQAAKQTFDCYRAKGMEEEVLVRAIQETAAHGAKSPLAYLKRVLEKAEGAGQYTLSDWEAGRQSPGGARRVDRAAPSGNDFLADALTRPRRHKRK